MIPEENPCKEVKCCKTGACEICTCCSRGHCDWEEAPE